MIDSHPAEQSAQPQTLFTGEAELSLGVCRSSCGRVFFLMVKFNQECAKIA